MSPKKGRRGVVTMVVDLVVEVAVNVISNMNEYKDRGVIKLSSKRIGMIFRMEYIDY